jgi:hypothetical protein
VMERGQDSGHGFLPPVSLVVAATALCGILYSYNLLLVDVQACTAEAVEGNERCRESTAARLAPLHCSSGSQPHEPR